MAWRPGLKVKFLTHTVDQGKMTPRTITPSCLPSGLLTPLFTPANRNSFQTNSKLKGRQEGVIVLGVSEKFYPHAAHLVMVQENCLLRHRRTRRGGGRGGLQPPQLQKFLKFFGQNGDDSGKSTREKILLKVVKARLEGYFL